MYYAVHKGIKPGIYRNWNDCKANVIGFKGAVYKKFAAEDQATEFYENGVSVVKNDSISVKPETFDLEGKNYSFVDGSFNETTMVYGYGGFIVAGDMEYVLQGSGDDPEYSKMWNVSGELSGSLAAVSKAIDLGLKEIIILFDFQGIESWATGKWKRNHKPSIEYHEFFQKIKPKIKVSFIKVKAHTGVPGNERADKLAKEAVGL